MPGPAGRKEPMCVEMEAVRQQSPDLDPVDVEAGQFLALAFALACQLLVRLLVLLA